MSADLFSAMQTSQKEYRFTYNPQGGMVFWRGESFTINAKGIHFSRKYLLSAPVGFPKEIIWSECQAVRYISKPIRGSAQLSNRTLLETLAFKVRNGWVLVPLLRMPDIPLFIGKEHPLSPKEAISKFYGSMAEATPEEEAAFPGYTVDDLRADLGKKVQHVAFAALAIPLLGMLLAGYGKDAPYLLDVSGIRADNFISYGIGFLGFIATFLYLFRGTDIKITVLLGILMGVLSSFFLAMPLVYKLPLWLGEKTTETFRLEINGTRCQFWQGVSAPDITFFLYVKKENRVYSEIGTEKQFTIYRNLLWQAAMPSSEYETIFKPGQKIITPRSSGWRETCEK